MNLLFTTNLPLLRSLATLLLLILPVQMTIAAGAGSAPTAFNQNASQQALSGSLSSDAKAQRRILVRFKAGSPFAGKLPLTTGKPSMRDTADRPMPINGVKHLKSVRLGGPPTTGQSLGINGQGQLLSQGYELTVLEITDPDADRDALIRALIDSGEVEYAEPDFCYVGQPDSE